jgi:hypothetical protein
MAERVLTQGALNRALLARQLLLERSSLSIPEAVEQVGGLQTQYAPSGYVGLWTRLAGFRRDDLTAALQDHSVIQATLLRTTIHMVSRREYWRYAAGVREARRTWALRAWTGATEEASVRTAGELRAALQGEPKTVKELGGLANGFVGTASLWVDLVRVPPSGTWARRRADRLALAEEWVGPPDATEEEGKAFLVAAYLRAYGPAAWKDIPLWSGVLLPDLRKAAANLTLTTYRDEQGRTLVDLPDAPLPDPDTPAPVRFLPHWDANLLVHARRTGLLPEEHRARVFHTKNPFSVGVVLVDGRAVAAWSLKAGRIVLDPFEAIPAGIRDAVEEERAALEAFHG